MELTNEFTVAVPLDRAWEVLTDIERIAPCMPGAELTEVDGDQYRGMVKVKVGPITAQYKGVASLISKDDDAHRAVVSAEGRETRGQGNANATVTATLEADGDSTRVLLVTELTVTGKVAQFGRGVMADVSGRLLTQFVDCLHADLLSGAATPPPNGDWQEAEQSAQVTPAAADRPASEAAPGPRRIESAPAEPIDLGRAAAVPVAKRTAPLIALVFLAYWLFRRNRKRRRA